MFLRVPQGWGEVLGLMEVCKAHARVSGGRLKSGRLRQVFHPSDHLGGPPLDPIQQVAVFAVLKAPELDAGLQVGSHQSGVEAGNCLP